MSGLPGPFTGGTMHKEMPAGHETEVIVYRVTVGCASRTSRIRHPDDIETLTGWFRTEDEARDAVESWKDGGCYAYYEPEPDGEKPAAAPWGVVQ